MKPNILLACKKSPCFPPKETVLGQLPLGQITLTQTPTLTGRQFSSKATVRIPVKTKETKNRKEIKERKNK